MGRLQVLVATMHQTDFSLIEKMNIQADVIIANQADYEAVNECSFGPYHAKMITTRTRGVGVNRNIALQAADAEIVLFADDDIVYQADIFSGVLKAFDEIPQADLIVFGADYTKAGEVYLQRHYQTKKCYIWNSMGFGAAFLAARRQRIAEKNLLFSELFGGGCIYGSGEDSLFLKNCLDKNLTLFSHELVIGKNSKDESTWFCGFDKKFFFDKGAWTAAAFPKIKHFVKWYFLLRFWRSSQISIFDMLRQYNRGIQYYGLSRPYSE